MPQSRVHITGASGSGTTTLGRALADALGVPCHDSDDFYWLPTDPPYRAKRAVADRLRLCREIFLDRDGWVLSGALESWGEEVVRRVDAIVYLAVPAEVRIARLRAREARRFGLAAVQPGGWRHRETEDFIEWASHYDDGTREGRSLARHVSWLARQTCLVVRLDGTRPTSELVALVTEKLR